MYVYRSKNARSVHVRGRQRVLKCRCGSRARCGNWWWCSSLPTTCHPGTTRWATETSLKPLPEYACCHHCKVLFYPSCISFIIISIFLFFTVYNGHPCTTTSIFSFYVDYTRVSLLHFPSLIVIIPILQKIL